MAEYGVGKPVGQTGGDSGLDNDTAIAHPRHRMQESGARPHAPPQRFGSAGGRMAVSEAKFDEIWPRVFLLYFFEVEVAR